MNPELFEPYHEILDGIRNSLADGKLQTRSEPDLTADYAQLEAMVAHVESLYEQATRLNDAITAIGKAIQEEMVRREIIASNEE